MKNRVASAAMANIEKNGMNIIIIATIAKTTKAIKMGIASKRKKCAYDRGYLLKVLSGLQTGIESR